MASSKTRDAGRQASVPCAPDVWLGASHRTIMDRRKKGKEEEVKWSCFSKSLFVRLAPSLSLTQSQRTATEPLGEASAVWKDSQIHR